MAGSRVEHFGTIFSRVTGLLKSGAMKEADKPIWYDVYAAFPPRVAPSFEREVPKGEICSIMYKEDVIRAQFYKTFGSPDVIDMDDSKLPSLSQRFVDKYKQLESNCTATSQEELFSTCVKALSSQGYKLKTLAEQKLESDAKKKLIENMRANEKHIRTLSAVQNKHSLSEKVQIDAALTDPENI